MGGMRMTVSVIEAYMMQYGILALFIIVLLEYMNIPGLPAGVIMPFAGILAKGGEYSFIRILIVTSLAGLIGSWILYGVGRYCGKPILEWYKKSFTTFGKCYFYSFKTKNFFTKFNYF